MLRALAVIPRSLRARVASRIGALDLSIEDEREDKPQQPLEIDSVPHWLGATEPALLIAGHSHRLAFFEYFLRSGQSARIAILHQRDPVPVLDTDSSKVMSDPYWPVAISSARERGLPLAIVWDGNQHNSMFMFESEEPFSVFPANGPWHDGHPRPLIPRSLLRQFFDLGFSGLRTVLSNSSDTEVVLLGTPPPKSDDQIRAGINSEPLLVDAASRLGMTPASLRLTPLAVRFELWRITQELLSAIADEFARPFIGVPEAALSGGALPPDASAADATHANGLWGETMIRETKRHWPFDDEPSL